MTNYRKRVGYAKIGRAVNLTQDKWGTVGGDDEAPLMLKDLAFRNPDIEFVLVGRNTAKESPQAMGLPENVTNPWLEWGPAIRERVKREKGDRGMSPMSLETQQWLIGIHDDITMQAFGDLDDIIMWWGQHGSTNQPIPKIGTGDWGNLTKPQDAFVHYASYLTRGINFWRRQKPLEFEEIHVIADARNNLKLRDLKWPWHHPVLGQYIMNRTTKHVRFGDARTPEDTGFDDIAKWVEPDTWASQVKYAYSRLEICGIMPWHIDSRFSNEYDGRGRFGLFINEARSYVKHNRLDALTQYVLPLEPDWIHGNWSKESLEKIDRDIQPAPWEVYYDRIRSVRCTFTTPSSGSGWATTKPWQAFAVGTVCFFHPQYDTQDNILGDMPAELREWLRVDSPETLRKRVEFLNDPQNKNAWLWLVQAQREHYDKAVEEARHLQLIEDRINE